MLEAWVVASYWAAGGMGQDRIQARNAIRKFVENGEKN